MAIHYLAEPFGIRFLPSNAKRELDHDHHEDLRSAQIYRSSSRGQAGNNADGWKCKGTSPVTRGAASEHISWTATIRTIARRRSGAGCDTASFTVT